jgi:sugar/nucleoside kinase (ribokinase family)
LSRIVAVGSVAFDSIKSPFGAVERELGGSATYFALAASYFTDVAIVGVVGEDFEPQHEAVLTSRGVNLDGVERRAGKTFFWAGEYHGEDLNQAITNCTELNVFETFKPQIPPSYGSAEFLFLGNIHPSLQVDVRHALPRARLVTGDTMNYWIHHTPAELRDALKVMDVLLINDTEARSLAAETNLPRAALRVLAMGPRALVIKHGEYGATIFFREGAFGIGRHPFRAPALPIEEVKDPTGAGDSFAGGFFGYIASQGVCTREVLRRAMFYGGVMGSFAVEDFGTRRLQQLTREKIDERFQMFRELTHLG